MGLRRAGRAPAQVEPSACNADFSSHLCRSGCCQLAGKETDSGSLVRAGCSPTYLKSAAWIPPTLKSKIKRVQCLHVSLLSQQGAVGLPKGQGEVTAQAPGNLSHLSIHGYRGCWSFEVQVGDRTRQESTTGCPGG